MKLSVVILAAGQGKRMGSAIPKVLHELAGKPLLEHVVNTARALKPECINVVYGHNGEAVMAKLPNLPVRWVYQEEQLGTGHAVAQALPGLSQDEIVLVLFGDVPLISLITLQRLIKATPQNGIGLLVADAEDPTGLGRIIRSESGDVLAIVEDRDANDEQRKVKEIFTGILTAPVHQLTHWLANLNNDNAQEEYYLTQVPALAIEESILVTCVRAETFEEVQGINDRKQLAQLERYYQRCQADALMLQGVSLRDPTRFDVRGDVRVGQDITIDANVILEGEVSLGNHVHIGSNCVLRNVRIGDNVHIKENCVIDGAEIAANCTIGPFARVRPETVLNAGVQLGNFVEIKKSTLGEGSKVSHLSYVGDTQMGSGVNVGAGTITCNYDGAFKHKTVIENNCFIGSGTQLVAPVTIGAEATIGAGSTITKTAPPGKLTLARCKQSTVQTWQRPKKETTSKPE